MTQPIPLIYERISLVMADVGAVGKDEKNQQQGWKFRSIDQIKNATNPAFVRHRVFYSPEVLEDVQTEQVTKNGSKMIHHKIKVKYRLFTTDGSFVDAIVYGEAADTGDKALGKAQTYAEKVMLIQVLNLATEEQKEQDLENDGGGAGSDPDRHSHELGVENTNSPESGACSENLNRQIDIPTSPPPPQNPPIKKFQDNEILQPGEYDFRIDKQMVSKFPPAVHSFLFKHKNSGVFFNATDSDLKYLANLLKLEDPKNFMDYIGKTVRAEITIANGKMKVLKLVDDIPF